MTYYKSISIGIPQGWPAKFDDMAIFYIFANIHHDWKVSGKYYYISLVANYKMCNINDAIFKDA